MKTSVYAIRGLVGLAAAIGLVSNIWAQSTDDLREWIDQNAGQKKYTPDEVMRMTPPGPNPWLSIAPAGKSTNWSYWNTRRATEASIKAQGDPPANVRIQAKRSKGTVIKGFGSNPPEVSEIDIDATSELDPPVSLVPSPEDEGSILLATPTGLMPGNAVRVSAEIGDGPFGSAGSGSGDVDFFMIPGVEAGQAILVDVDTPLPFGSLDPFVVLYDATGEIIALNDDDGSSFDSFLIAEAPASGDYYVSLTGFGTFILDDPFDSSTGLGASSEGTYEVTIGLDYFDDLSLAFKLRKSDIFGASINGLPGIMILTDKTTLVRQGSGQDVTFIHPAASPLPGGTAALSHTVDTTGNFSMRIVPLGTGPYTVSLRVFKNPLLFGTKGDVQTLFIDFDGETINAQEIFGFGNNPAVLSPLVDYLPGWGLTAADEDEVIDAILASVEESIRDDIKRRGREPKFDIRILNSRDHADPFGQPNVSRLIVGGSIPELGIGTLGIAESIDVGNFETKETAVILLDLLSAPDPNPNSLNTLPRAPGVSIIDVIAAGVGNITSHEAGHYLGNWHTEQFETPPNIMDQGGNLPNTVGVGDDGIFGTADDVDVDFGVDIFVPNEGFFGSEDTLNSVAIGDPAPRSGK